MYKFFFFVKFRHKLRRKAYVIFLKKLYSNFYK